jgi:hypothetical protein
MKDLRAMSVYARVTGLLVGALLFIIAVFDHGDWQLLCGIGLAIVSAVFFFDEATGISFFHRQVGAPSRLHMLVKSLSYAGAAALFLLGGIINDGDATLTLFALGFLLIGVAAAADHFAEFAVVRRAFHSALDAVQRDEPTVAAAAPPAAAMPPAPAPAPAAAAPVPESAAGDTCAKCGHVYTDPDQRFCPVCGTARGVPAAT